jgi:signal transduction histidine kinase
MQQDDAYLINISGKQRMNSQKTAYIALISGVYKEGFKNKEEYKTTIDEMQSAFMELSPHLLEMDFNKYEELQNSLEEYVALGETIMEQSFRDNKTIFKFLELSERMIYLFDQATKSLEKHSQKKLDQTKNTVLFLLFTLLLILIIEANFIFKPAILQSAKRSRELNNLNKTLEERVALEIEENRKKELILIQKTKQAEIGELVDSIAHQWKNPLSIMMLYIGDAKLEMEGGYESMDSDRVLENLNKAEDTVEYMSSTVQDFRSFYLPSTNVATFSIYSSVKKVEKLISHLFMRHKIDIENRFLNQRGEELDESQAKEHYLIDGKSGEFEQCLMVLLNNAKDAINSFKEGLLPPYRGLVKVCVQDRDGEVVIDITDNGSGIPDSVKSSLFEPYFTTKGENGSGVGLYMCRTILNKHFEGEIILLESKPQKTVFRLSVKSKKKEST